MKKFICEILQEINENPKLLQEQYKDNAALRILFTHAFVKDAKFILPEGDPPFTESPEPLGMTPTNLLNEVRKLNIYCRADLKPIRRESLFIQLLEALHPDEAKILLAVKDQKLHKMFRKIKKKYVIAAGFIPDDKQVEDDADE